MAKAASFSIRPNMLLAAAVSLPTWTIWAGSFITYWFAYPVFNFILLHHKQYARLDQDRRQYVISNLLKAILLGVFSVVMIDLVLDLVLHSLWDGPTMKVLAPLYVNLDVVSLFRVKRMMRSTMVHHVLVAIFGMVVAYFPVRPGTVTGHICIYALFSMLAYFVNGFLALRFLSSGNNRKFINVVARACGAGYLAICMIHWLFHAYNMYLYWTTLWFLPVCFIGFIYDDLVLMTWLFRFKM